PRRRCENRVSVVRLRFEAGGSNSSLAMTTDRRVRPSWGLLRRSGLAVLYTHIDSEARHLARRGLKRRDRPSGIVHDEVIAVVPVPSDFLAREGYVPIRCRCVAVSPNDGRCEEHFETGAKMASCTVHGYYSTSYQWDSKPQPRRARWHGQAIHRVTLVGRKESQESVNPGAGQENSPGLRVPPSIPGGRTGTKRHAAWRRRPSVGHRRPLPAALDE